MQSDLARLKTIIEADHVFNNTAASNDGIHKQVKLLNRAQPVNLVNGESGILFSIANAQAQSQVWYFNSNATLPTTSIKSFVNFDGSSLTIRGSYNVASVTRWPGGPGRYRITFAVPFVANASGDTYTTQITTMNSTTHTIGNIRLNTLLSSSQTDTYVDIETVNRSSGTYVDCQYVGVTINSVL
jgi:hypothetical protein